MSLFHEIYLAVVDRRTCDECLALHGSIYPAGTGPKLPRHPRCRCEYMFIDVSNGNVEEARERIMDWWRGLHLEADFHVLSDWVQSSLRYPS